MAITGGIMYTLMRRGKTLKQLLPWLEILAENFCTALIWDNDHVTDGKSLDKDHVTDGINGRALG